MDSSNNQSGSVLFKVEYHDFPASLSLIACYILIHFVSLSITWPKKAVSCLCILFMIDLVVSASRNAVLVDFFAVS